MASFVFAFMLLLLAAHAVLLESYRRWFLQMKPLQPSPVLKPSIFFTVIIPARNEAENIEACLQSVLTQAYPQTLFEVIVADDYSEDDTAKIVEELQKKFKNLRLFRLQDLLPKKQLNSYKKKAIELAIENAKGEWMVTTDADCIVNKNWLANFANLIAAKNPVFIAAPVKIMNTGSFIFIFQSLDFMSLQGITAASVQKGFHSMCNGANLAYRKNVFYEVGGFSGIDNIASGDDMLLMHKVFLRYSTQVQYLFSQTSVVQTQPVNSWKDFFSQRIRWASKAGKYDDKRIFWVLLFVYFFNVSFLILGVAAIWFSFLWWCLLAMLLAKTVIDLRFMLPVARFFQEERLLWWFPVMQPIHIIYTIAAGWLGQFGQYSWKGRVVK